MKTNRKTAVFLDRDGTLNFDPGYLSKAKHFRFLPSVKPALRMLVACGLDLFVVSNQSGIGRGLITQQELKKIHSKMTRELKASGVVLKGIFICPHSPADGCACRKPSPKLILKAVRRHRLNLWNSYIVGDKLTDVETGVRAGLQTVLIARKKSSPDAAIRPYHVAKNLMGAAKWIIERHKILDAGYSTGKRIQHDGERNR